MHGTMNIKKTSGNYKLSSEEVDSMGIDIEWNDLQTF